MLGERWTTSEHLLASAVEALMAANWQRAGRKNAPRPKPIQRPGTKDPDRERWGTESLTVTEYRRRRRQKGRKR